MKHFLRKNKHHFGLWALSGLVLLWSIIWLNSLEKKTVESPSPKVLINTPPSFLKADNEQIAVSNTSKIILNLPPAKESTGFVANSSVTGTVKKGNSVIFQFISQGGEKDFQIAIVENETVYDVMLRLKAEQGLIFDAKDYSGLGAFVDSINGLANNPKENKFWIYYLNGKAAPMGISLTKLHFNDLITWRYESSNF